MHSRETITLALDLLARGYGSSEVARRLRISRSTVENWRRRGAPRERPVITSWEPPDEAVYSYLLGLYLGDGCIVKQKGNSFFLRPYLDNRYEAVIQSARVAMEATFPDRVVRRYDYGREERTILHVSFQGLALAFPQHGPGKKHDRKIELVPWQTEITRAHPAALIRGLIHSDGCRTINRFKTTLPSGRVAEYEYPRYFFSNLSADIRQIFIEHCELLGIRCTTGHERNVSVAHRTSVAILEEIVGPKS